MKRAICIFLLFLAACTDDSSSPTVGNILVYIDKGALQCETSGISAEESAQVLINAGIDVLESTCGFQTGLVFPDICGGETGALVVHDIRFENLPDAEQLGYANVSSLIDLSRGLAFQLVDCEFIDFPGGNAY